MSIGYRTSTLWHVMAGQRLRYSAAVAAMLGATVVGYLEPLIPALVIDGLIRDDLEASPAIVVYLVELLGGREFLVANLWLPAVLLVGLMLVAGSMHFLRARLAAQASETVCRNLRNRLYSHLQALPAAYHESVETGDIVQRCTSDVETLRMFLAQQVVEIGRAVLLLAAVVPFMLWIDATMTLVALVMIPVIVVFATVFFLAVKRIFRQADEAEGRMTGRLQENLTAIRVVRAFARQDYEKQRFAGLNQAYRDHQQRLYNIMAAYWSSTDFLCLIQLGLVLVVGGWRVMHGELSPGALFAFLAYVNMLLWPIRQMGRILTDSGKAVVAIGRIGEILDEQAERDPPPDRRATLPEPVQGRIELAGVSFAYDGEPPVIDDVSLTIEPGQTLAILGPSGAGKSTLVQLMLRLHDPQAGRIHLDGVPIDTLPRMQVRRQFGVVLQEPFLYSRTVSENIRLGQWSATPDQLIEASTSAAVHEAIESFVAGYDTVVGERGARVSGGQRQRIALARALIKDPPVLVLDDALSAVDTQTERVILKALRRRHAKRTTIVIAHRLSTLMEADRIIVLDHGRIVQQGTHETLVREDGLYRRLWAIQNEEIATNEHQ